MNVSGLSIWIPPIHIDKRIQSINMKSKKNGVNRCKFLQKWGKFALKVG